MKQKKLDKKMSLKKNTVSNLEVISMEKVQGGDVWWWTLKPCSYFWGNCVTNADSAPCC